MACLISSSRFCVPVSSSKIVSWASVEGRAANPVVKLSTQANQRPVMLAAFDSTRRSMYYSTWSYHQHTLAAIKTSYGRISCILTVFRKAQTAISGYWTGPDIEDGWGFVDAYVYQIT